MPLQTTNFQWVRQKTEGTRLCTIKMKYFWEAGESTARKVSKTSIVIDFYQVHDVHDSAEDVAIAMKNFAETMFEEAAVEIGV